MKDLVKNPIGFIALFISLIYGFANSLLATATLRTPDERSLLILFIVLFPVVVLGVFYLLISRHRGKLCAPAHHPIYTENSPQLQPNWRLYAGRLAAGVFFSALVSAAGATESGGGRPVAGTAVNPSAGVVPDQPIMMFNLGLQAVDGNIGANKQIPIAGRIAGEAENQYTAESLSLFKVWDTGPGAWHFASSLTMLFMQSKVTVQAFVPAAPELDRSARVAGLYDLAITPIVAGYHFSKDEHLSLSLRVWAPTGRYVSGKLVNLSQNVWTAIPSLSYTRYLPQGWEVSSVATLNFSTRNEASNYQSAPLFTLDVLGSKKLGDGWAIGAIAGWIEQIGKDSGPLADKLNGFRGSELAFGPIVTYSSKIGSLPLSSSFRWMNTVSQRDRMDRNTVYLSFSVPLPQ